MKYSIIFTTVIALAVSSQLVSAGEITDTYAVGDTLTATKMDNIKAAVNDNDGRITALESPATTTGRIFVPTLNAGSGFFTLDEAATSISKTVTFARPSDYVSAGSNDITIRAYFSGCSGSSVAISLRRATYSEGINSTLSIITPLTTVAIPSVSLFQLYLREYSITGTGFGDVNHVTFTRGAGTTGDTCTTDLHLRLIVIEYPKDPSL